MNKILTEYLPNSNLLDKNCFEKLILNFTYLIISKIIFVINFLFFLISYLGLELIKNLIKMSMFLYGSFLGLVFKLTTNKVMLKPFASGIFKIL